MKKNREKAREQREVQHDQHSADNGDIMSNVPESFSNKQSPVKVPVIMMDSMNS